MTRIGHDVDTLEAEAAIMRLEIRKLENELAAARKVVAAAGDTLAMLEELTTAKFEHGGDRPQREELERTLTAYRAATESEAGQ